MLPEFWENRFIELLQKLNNYFKFEFEIENLENKNIVIDAIEEQDIEMFNILSEFNSTFEAYRFIRSDRDLMMKARNIWEMERKNFVEALKKIDGELKELLAKKEIL